MSSEKNLRRYIAESEKARSILADKLKRDISCLDFQIALSTVLGYEYHDTTQILDHELTVGQMLEKLDEYVF